MISCTDTLQLYNVHRVGTSSLHAQHATVTHCALLIDFNDTKISIIIILTVSCMARDDNGDGYIVTYVIISA